MVLRTSTVLLNQREYHYEYSSVLVQEYSYEVRAKDALRLSAGQNKSIQASRNSKIYLVLSVSVLAQRFRTMAKLTDDAVEAALMQKIYQGSCEVRQQFVRKWKNELLKQRTTLGVSSAQIRDSNPAAIRVMQRNILADGLSQDGFLCNPITSSWPCALDSVPLNGASEKIESDLRLRSDCCTELTVNDPGPTTCLSLWFFVRFKKRRWIRQVHRAVRGYGGGRD